MTSHGKDAENCLPGSRLLQAAGKKIAGGDRDGSGKPRWVSADHSPLLAELLPFLKGMTLLFWATATWWIPVLVILGIWRHLIRRFPFRYDPLYWGAVF